MAVIHGGDPSRGWGVGTAGGQRGPASRAALHSRQQQVLHPHPSVSLWGTFLVGTGEGGGETGWNFFFGNSAQQPGILAASWLQGQEPGRGKPCASSCPKGAAACWGPGPPGAGGRGWC